MIKIKSHTTADSGCPYCGSNNITTQESEWCPGDSQRRVECSCQDCEQNWTWEYRLTRIHAEKVQFLT